MKEGEYQTYLIKQLKMRFPGAIVLKNDSGYQQGIPDLSIFWGMEWAFLEVKVERPTKPEDFEPNQEYFVDLADTMSFGATIYPGNEEEVLDALQQAFASSRHARFSESVETGMVELRRGGLGASVRRGFGRQTWY